MTSENGSGRDLAREPACLDAAPALYGEKEKTPPASVNCRSSFWSCFDTNKKWPVRVDRALHVTRAKLPPLTPGRSLPSPNDLGKRRSGAEFIARHQRCRDAVHCAKRPLSVQRQPLGRQECATIGKWLGGQCRVQPQGRLNRQPSERHA